MSEIQKVIAAAINWLEREALRVPYGEVGVVLILHAGRVARIEKTTVERNQPTRGDRL